MFQALRLKSFRTRRWNDVSIRMIQHTDTNNATVNYKKASLNWSKVPHKLIPLAPEYFDKALDLLSNQFSSSNSVGSPVYMGLGISKQEYIEKERTLLDSLINSPSSCLLVNPNNDDIMAITVLLRDQDKSKSNSSNATQKMDKYVMSKLSKQDKVFLNQLKANEYVIGQFGCVNPKYGKQNLIGLSLMYHSIICKINNYKYIVACVPNEYALKGHKRSFGDAMNVCGKTSYADIFDYLGIEYKNNQIEGLLHAINRHPYRYFAIYDLYNDQYSQILQQFVMSNNGIHKQQIDAFLKMTF